MWTDTLFSAGNQIALTGWVALVFAALAGPRHRWALRWSGFAVPGVLAIAYVGLVIEGRDAFAGGGFSSLAAVRALFANDALLTAGWFHYLAFDLFVGTWIVREGHAAGAPGWLLVLCLPPTFLLGPSGLLLFFVLRPLLGRSSRETRS